MSFSGGYIVIWNCWSRGWPPLFASVGNNCWWDTTNCETFPLRNESHTRKTALSDEWLPRIKGIFREKLFHMNAEAESSWQCRFHATIILSLTFYGESIYIHSLIQSMNSIYDDDKWQRSVGRKKSHQLLSYPLLTLRAISTNSFF